VRVRATSKLLAVAGDPVVHSVSPAMHNAAIEALGLDAVYVAARTTARAFPGLVYSLLEAGGALNVTAPFKQQAAALVDHPSETVRRTGACNTIWGDADAPSGDNTDVVGVQAALKALLGDQPPATARIHGTGGSARAVAVALADAYPGADVAVASRDASRAASFVEWAASAGARCRPARHGEATDVAINCTPLTDALPWPEPPRALLDLNCRPGHTPMVRAHLLQGLQASDGRVMLVEQGAASFERFFGVPGPVEVMRAAVEDALRA